MCIHTGFWAHRQRAIATFFIQKTPHIFLVLLTGFNPQVDLAADALPIEPPPSQCQRREPREKGTHPVQVSAPVERGVPPGVAVVSGVHGGSALGTVPAWGGVGPGAGGPPASGAFGLAGSGGLHQDLLGLLLQLLLAKVLHTGPSHTHTHTDRHTHTHADRHTHTQTHTHTHIIRAFH